MKCLMLLIKLKVANLNILPEGLPGLCKAHLNKHICKQIKCQYLNISLGPF